MKKHPAFLTLIFVAMVLSACSTEQVSRNLYEGIKAHNESFKSTPMERTKGEGLSYDQYERERKAGAAGRSE